MAFNVLPPPARAKAGQSIWWGIVAAVQVLASG